MLRKRPDHASMHTYDYRYCNCVQPFNQVFFITSMRTFSISRDAGIISSIVRTFELKFLLREMRKRLCTQFSQFSMITSRYRTTYLSLLLQSRTCNSRTWNLYIRVPVLLSLSRVTDLRMNTINYYTVKVLCITVT